MGALLSIQVIHCPQPGQVDRVDLQLSSGATVADALRASGLAERHPGLDAASVGVWGHVQPLDHPLRDRDRVEWYRPLTVDPKEARRLRYGAQRRKDQR
jgi:putative ubiquitin-RnfH superfamily antitoxin RatB of RatAB toxin-antitoxin module